MSYDEVANNLLVASEDRMHYPIGCPMIASCIVISADSIIIEVGFSIMDIIDTFIDYSTRWLNICPGIFYKRDSEIGTRDRKCKIRIAL